MLGTVVVPAHNEAAVIGRCLDGLIGGTADNEFEVVVACNGCTDATAEIARRRGARVTVIEIAEPSKSGAIRAAEAVCAPALPRLYVDADVELTSSAVRAVLERLTQGAVAARPPIVFDTADATACVQRYYRARANVPSVMNRLWGAGVYGLSVSGRERLGEFPTVTADDLWVDAQFAAAEIEIVDCDPVVVHAPRVYSGLRNVLRRVHRGGRELRGLEVDSPSTTRTTVRELADYGRRGWDQALDAAVYATVAARSRVDDVVGTTRGWERDDSSRVTR